MKKNPSRLLAVFIVLFLCVSVNVKAQQTLSKTETFVATSPQTLPFSSAVKAEEEFNQQLSLVSIAIYYAGEPSQNGFSYFGKHWPYTHRVGGGMYSLGEHSIQVVANTIDNYLSARIDNFLAVAGSEPNETSFLITASFVSDLGMTKISYYSLFKEFSLAKNGSGTWHVPPTVTFEDFVVVDPLRIGYNIPHIKHASVHWRRDANEPPFSVEHSVESENGVSGDVLATIPSKNILLLPFRFAGKANRENLHGEFIIKYSSDGKLTEKYDVQTGKKITTEHVHLSIDDIDGGLRLVIRGQCGPGPVTIESSSDLVTWSEIATFSNYSGLVAIPLQQNGERRLFRARMEEE